MVYNTLGCFGIVAPYYNLVLVAIVIFLFVFLFRIPNKKVFHKPWKLLFVAVLIFIVEEIITVLNGLGIKTVPHFVFGFFEMAIIGIFIYTLLIQKEHMKKGQR